VVVFLRKKEVNWSFYFYNRVRDMMCGILGHVVMMAN